MPSSILSRTFFVQKQLSESLSIDRVGNLRVFVQNTIKLQKFFGLNCILKKYLLLPICIQFMVEVNNFLRKMTL